MAPPAIATSTSTGRECCFCLKDGAAAPSAPCGCAYHPCCLEEYLQLEECSPDEEKRCHIHGAPLPEVFVAQHLPGYTLFPISPGACKSTARASKSIRPASQSETLRGSFGVPCVICLGEDGLFKTLHCGFKIHASCLKDYWIRNVTSRGRLTGIECPAESEGCTECLSQSDMNRVLVAQDFIWADQHLQNLDDQNRALIDDLRMNSLKRVPMFRCAICLTDHEVEGSCTLPCQHRFCFESLQYHFDIIVRERRLDRLVCPAENCGFSLRSEEHIHIFKQCLSAKTYNKLLEFLVRDDPRICECPHRGCDERIFLDCTDDYTNAICPKGHRFCAKCENGPHPRMSCQARQEQLNKARKQEQDRFEQDAAWQEALEMGWKPCPRRCSFGGGFKASDECDHVTCQCGFQFCWDCGVDRNLPLLHDNRWHKPSCRYYTNPSEVKERPAYCEKCPECKKRPRGQVCPFPVDDGYPRSFFLCQGSNALDRHRPLARSPNFRGGTPVKARAKPPLEPSMPSPMKIPAKPSPVELQAPVSAPPNQTPEPTFQDHAGNALHVLKRVLQI